MDLIYHIKALLSRLFMLFLPGVHRSSLHREWSKRMAVSAVPCIFNVFQVEFLIYHHSITNDRMAFVLMHNSIILLVLALWLIGNSQGKQAFIHHWFYILIHNICYRHSSAEKLLYLASASWGLTEPQYFFLIRIDTIVSFYSIIKCYPEHSCVTFKFRSRQTIFLHCIYYGRDTAVYCKKTERLFKLLQQ